MVIQRYAFVRVLLGYVGVVAGVVTGVKGYVELMVLSRWPFLIVAGEQLVNIPYPIYPINI